MNKFEDMIKYIKSVLESPEKLEELREKRMVNDDSKRDDKISDAMITIQNGVIKAFIEYKDTIKTQNQKIAIDIRTNKTSDASFGKVLLIATDNMFYLENSNSGHKVDYGKESIQAMVDQMTEKCKEFRTKIFEQDGTFIFEQSRDISHDEIVIKENLKIAIEKIAQYEQEERQERILKEHEGYESQQDKIIDGRQRIAQNGMKSISPKVTIDHEVAKKEARKKGHSSGSKGQGIK